MRVGSAAVIGGASTFLFSAGPGAAVSVRGSFSFALNVTMSKGCVGASTIRAEASAAAAPCAEWTDSVGTAIAAGAAASRESPVFRYGGVGAVTIAGAGAPEWRNRHHAGWRQRRHG
jgi:hypothetical protein